MMQLFEEWAYPMREGQQVSSTDERYLAERLSQLQAAWQAEAEQEEPQYREAAIARWAKAREQTEATIAQIQDRADVLEIQEIANALEQLERMEPAQAYCQQRDFDWVLEQFADGVARAREEVARLEPGARERWGEDYESEVQFRR